MSKKVGFIGLGKIGMPICKSLIDAGYEVHGFRRSAMTDFEAMGGKPARSPAEIARLTNIIFSCLPSDEALEATVNGPDGLLEALEPGTIYTELGSHPVAIKESYVSQFAEKGATFIDGEVSGTPGMVAGRVAPIYLAGPEAEVKKLAPYVDAFTQTNMYLGAFGAATKVKLVNNFMVGMQIAGTAQAMAFGLKLGIEPDKLIPAVGDGSGGSQQFKIRAPWMAERKFLPMQGSAPGLAYYLSEAKKTGDEIGISTELMDMLIGIYERAIPGIGERDVAALIEYFENKT